MGATSGWKITAEYSSCGRVSASHFSLKTKFRQFRLVHLSEVPMKRFCSLCFVAAVLASAISRVAQGQGGSERLTQAQLNARAKAYNVAEIPWQPVATFIKLPNGMYLGQGVRAATTWKGHVV